MVGGGGRALLCAQILYYGRDQLDCPPPNGLNHYLPLNKTGANSTGERFSATIALLLKYLLRASNFKEGQIYTKARHFEHCIFLAEKLQF